MSSAVSFLDQIRRIADPEYLPSTGMHKIVTFNRLTHGKADDILHVRLQTLGVTEHSFDIDIGGILFNWLLYDVGGAVSVRCMLSMQPI